ncbi:hypothetical protein FA95DRAFT_52201 [Auriscalpium vulgare]|uniref:Uncharacterized protein n=1 Tax=Auriscalpium vulgare TaxID=40419 RepID=A0ACB8S804_9AGAM|nr:hypothetical protein FA95DRAFT_52201 [Auriscalpium vulgare]
MAIMLPHPPSRLPPLKSCRRTATSVLAGDCDPRPARDVLTSVLNGVPVYKAVELDEEAKREQRRERKERAQEKKRAKLAAAQRDEPAAPEAVSAPPPVPPTPVEHHVEPSTSWGSRPVLHLATTLRSSSVTPPPMPSSPPTTPGPSISSSTSRTSSKRPHTPMDHDDYDEGSDRASGTPPSRPRKKRLASRKGWKGWVEGSPPPSEKLINLDDVKVLNERRTRSGKNFDGIGVGSGWV